MFVIKAYRGESRTVYEADAYTVDEHPDRIDIHFWKNHAKDEAPQLVVVAKTEHDFDHAWIENGNGKTCDSVACPPGTNP